MHDRGVRGFWFTDAQFIPARKYIEDAKELLRAIKAEGLTGIRWAAYIRADNLDPELAQLMVETGMSYFPWDVHFDDHGDRRTASRLGPR